MFYSLPAETVFEAKQRTRRATFYFFVLLVFLYVFFLDLLTAAFYVFIELWLQLHDIGKAPSVGTLLFYATPAAMLLAAVHYFSARGKKLDDLLDSLGAKDADPRDDYHGVFIRVVQEAEAATGLHPIRAVVLPSPGCNAFSLQDGQGRSAIGATDGLLCKLNRQELSAVVAHEAAHLVHEDSRLVTTACFLFGLFGAVNEALGASMGQSSLSYNRRSSSSGGFWGAVLVLWVLSGLGYLVTKLVFMAISREREYLADADGVAMCKDPLSLAEALYKISRRFRGCVSGSYSSLFILNPGDSDLDEAEGFFADLFSTHPPVSQRISRLLGWAKADLQTLQRMDQREQTPEKMAGPPAGGAPLGSAKGYMAYQGNQWIGPYGPSQLLSMGILNPSTWVCPAGSQQVMKASESAELNPLFLPLIQGSVTGHSCPRCKVSLVKSRHEGSDVEQCSFCKGYLLGPGVLERLVLRAPDGFTPGDIQKAVVWRDSQRGTLKERDSFPDIKCPLCKGPMGKGIHSQLTQVVIDHCLNENCGAVWCDGGELETIQMLIEDAHQNR